MHRTVSTAAEFQRTWDARINFPLADECAPFSFTFPSTREIVERLVAEERTTESRVSCARPATAKRHGAVSRMSFDELMETSFQFRFPDVTLLDRPGDLFAGFTEEVLNPWKRFSSITAFGIAAKMRWPGSPVPIPAPVTTWTAPTCSSGTCAGARRFTAFPIPTAGCRWRVRR